MGGKQNDQALGKWPYEEQEATQSVHPNLSDIAHVYVGVHEIKHNSPLIVCSSTGFHYVIN